MHPKDPRNNPNHRERGLVRYTYTVNDIANTLNRSVNTIKKLITTGKLDPSNLKSIIENYTKRY